MIEYKFKNADEAFNFYYGVIPYEGERFDNTFAMFNQGFTIENPLDRIVTHIFSLSFNTVNCIAYVQGVSYLYLDISLPSYIDTQACLVYSVK